LPINRSIGINRPTTAQRPVCSPAICQVTVVPVADGSKVKATSLVEENGLRKTSLTSTRSGAVPVISMLPAPALRLPRHA
jgi:hypothetical protein